MKQSSKKLIRPLAFLLMAILAGGVQAAEIGVEQTGEGNSVEFADGNLELTEIDVAIVQLGDNNLIELAINSDLQAFIEQTGVGGVVAIETSGGLHALRAVQEGVSNSMAVSLTGSGFDGLIEQSGSNNSLSINDSGIGNEASVYQSGSQNTMILIQSGSGNQVELTQSGSGNRLEVDQAASSLVLRVNQTGSNGVVRIN